MTYSPIDGNQQLTLQPASQNAAFQEVASWFHGGSEPTNREPFSKWLDDSGAELPLYVRNSLDTSWKKMWRFGTKCGPVIDDGSFEFVLTAGILSEDWQASMPAAKGTSQQSLRIASIDGDCVQLEWFTASGGITSIGGLTDVDITGITDGQGLAWDNANNRFEPVALGAGGGATTLDGLTDTDVVGVSTDDLLIFDGSDWAARTLLASDIPALAYMADNAGLGDLDMVGIGAPTTGHVLRHNGVLWQNQMLQFSDLPPITLSELSDVPNEPSGVKVLQSDNGTLTWEDKALTVGDIPALPYMADNAGIGDLADVGIGATGTGQVLRHNGVIFQNQALIFSDLPPITLSELNDVPDEPAGEKILKSTSGTLTWIDPPQVNNAFSQYELSSGGSASTNTNLVEGWNLDDFSSSPDTLVADGANGDHFTVAASGIYTINVSIGGANNVAINVGANKSNSLDNSAHKGQGANSVSWTGYISTSHKIWIYATGEILASATLSRLEIRKIETS